MGRIHDDVREPWASCDHEWVGRLADNQVTCAKCHCPGTEDEETGEVEWPTT